MDIEKVKFIRKQAKVALTYIHSTLTDKESVTPVKSVSDIDAVIGALGLIFFNTDTAAWLSASDKIQTMAEAFSVLTTSLEKRERLRFTVAKDELKVNGENVEFPGHYAKAFVTHLSSFGEINFTITKELEVDEFERLIAFMCKKPHEIAALGEFTDALTKEAFSHVSSKRILLREVSEEEMIVTKADLAAASAEEKKKIESEIVSFLAADKIESGDQKAANLRQAVGDSQMMSDLIMQAVVTKQGDLSLDRRQIGAMVVGCLDRAFDALIQDPFSKTQKGKKAIAGALKNLEKELLSRMAGGDPGDKQDDIVSGAIERMTERLKMDAIVQDYSRKLKSLEESEKHILRFIKLQGLEQIKAADLQKKLGDEGVDVDGWHKLLAMSGTVDGVLADEAQESQAAVVQLATLLDQLAADTKRIKERTPGAEKSPKQLAQDLKTVNSQVDTLTERMQKRINNLVDVVNADTTAVIALEQEATKKGFGLKLSRKELLVVLGEVVQELCQPIAVIKCSLEMMELNALGVMAPEQTEVIQLALQSIQKMHTLVTNLGRISGPPATRIPDKSIQQAVGDETFVL